ncbi:MAG: hypothetical protein A3B37_00600 [Candidatus Sungbacteria bacterium RIFCSPLOWO2_01_FULL_59_16]|uniref:Uncharacterized protein n=1 Tax=Candidatus Sungbacteria bacterium RIFCSPLOWO2_01_FULL_59_16 TaxID=1802280 RepID=A0A1G2LB19_9BACT|nr:MAG: hypothetical protein A3B37_00600 [Candidatus Sungbacteria bacterium RIFCSPLOWO2_01_FULL_59_16]
MERLGGVPTSDAIQHIEKCLVELLEVNGKFVDFFIAHGERTAVREFIETKWLPYLQAMLTANVALFKEIVEALATLPTQSPQSPPPPE